MVEKGMTAERLLEINGNFQKSPLLETLRRIDGLFEEYSVIYAVIGGLAVVRNGAVRTTADIDILTSREGWKNIREGKPKNFQMAPDNAVDMSTGVQIDILFDGDEWEMVIPMATPEAVNEYDAHLGAWFISLPHLLELKIAIYLKKLSEDGIEMAAKDLADVVSLLEKNSHIINDAFIGNIRIEVRDELIRILKKVQRQSAT